MTQLIRGCRSKSDNMRMNCRVLFIFLIYLFINPSISDPDFGQGLEPSLQLFEKVKDENLFETHEIEEAVGWKIESTEVVAVVGRLLNQSLNEIIRKYNPKLEISEETEISVHLSPLTEGWLIYRKDSHLLQGVPLLSHVDVTSPIIVVRNNAKVVTIPFKVRVSVSPLPTQRNKIDDNYLSFNCGPNEPMTVMSLTIQAPKSINKESRIALMLNTASFFNIYPNSVQIHDIPELYYDDRVFLSGVGNGHMSNGEYLIVSWAVGCSSIDDIEGLELVESSAQDGTLAQALGYDVVEWRVLNRPSTAKKMRIKREAARSPQDELLNPAGLKGKSSLAVTPIMRGEEAITLQGRGRTKVQLNLIRNTPMPAPAIVPSKLMTRNILRPSTTASLPKKSTETPKVENHVPFLVFGIGNFGELNAKMCRYFEYRIPDNAFFDMEDGETRNLNLQVFEPKTNKIIAESTAWPRFDTDSQILYGVPPTTTKPEEKLLLSVTDSGGKTTSKIFFINIDMTNKPKAYSHKFTFYFTEQLEKQQNDENFTSSFGRKLSAAVSSLNDRNPENDEGTLTMLKTGYAKNNQRYISWYDETLNSKTLCYGDELLKLATLMVGTNGIEGKNKPDKSFANKFRPEYKLRTVKIEYMGPCGSKTTINPQTTLVEQTEITVQPTEEYEEFTDLPPAITPPPFKSTSRATTTQVKFTTAEETTQPKVQTKPLDLVPKLTGKTISLLGSEVGKLQKIPIPLGTFTDPKTPEKSLKMRFVPIDNNHAMPTWIMISKDSHDILIGPTIEDFIEMVPYNSTHRKWDIGLVAENDMNKRSAVLKLEIFVRNNAQGSKDYNHKFQITIKNYDIKDFDLSMVAKLTSEIARLFGDGADTSNVFLHPLQKGSVIFSWHNSSLGSMKQCPEEAILKMSKKMFNDDKTITEEAYDTKLDLEVTECNLEKTHSCVPVGQVAPTPKDEETTTEGDEVEVGAAGGSGGIIIAVVIVCLVLLLIIVVVKCRMSKSSKKKKKEQEEMGALANPETPMHAQSPRISIKKGVPIIFQEELGRDQNGSPSTDATPLMDSNDQSSPRRSNGNTQNYNRTPVNGVTVFESTPLTQQSPMAGTVTPITAKRTPPPYHPR